MPTSMTFNSQYGGSPATSSSSSIDVTITASVDDGLISVGDEVTVDGLSSSVAIYSGIAIGGTATYVGIGVFNGQPGYVFTVDGALTNPDNVLVLTNEATTANDTLIAVSGYSNNTASQSLTLDPACFLAGTTVAAPGGARAVEELVPGDMICAADGRAVPVKWIGRQTVSTRFGPAERLMPVRFAAGSLSDGLPTADLTVTADHGMLVDGVICHAGALVNGTTITRVPLSEMGETYTVYHIETENHEIILANGAPAETFIDNVSRRVFDNYSEFEALYGDVPEMEELTYPRAMSARQVPSWIISKLARKAVA
jgi:hypothetical protein